MEPGARLREAGATPRRPVDTEVVAMPTTLPEGLPLALAFRLFALALGVVLAAAAWA